MSNILGMLGVGEKTVIVPIKDVFGFFCIGDDEMTGIEFRDNTESYENFSDGVAVVSGNLGEVCAQYGNLTSSKDYELKFRISDYDYGEHKDASLPDGLKVGSDYYWGDHGYEESGDVTVDEDHFGDICVRTDQKTGYCALAFAQPTNPFIKKKKQDSKEYYFQLNEEVNEVRRRLQETGFLELPGKEGIFYSQDKLKRLKQPEQKFNGEALAIVKQLQTLASQERADLVDSYKKAGMHNE